MKRLILIALIPTMVGCAGMTKQQTQLLGGVVGAAALNELGEGHKDRRWAIGLGTLAGGLIGSKLQDTTESGDWWKFWD